MKWIWRIAAILLLPVIGSGMLVQMQGYSVSKGLYAYYLQATDAALISGSEPLDVSSTTVLPLPVVWHGDLEDQQLTEASGLAVSNRQPNVLYSINDSGNSPELFAFSLSGVALGVWSIDYPAQHDFEDLASFELDGKQYLLIADTGDNLYWRPSVKLIVIEEPTPMDSDRGLITPSWVIELVYPDGQRDVESVAVDVASEAVYLLSKRRVPPELFRIPIRPLNKIAEAQFVGSLQGIIQPNEKDRFQDPEFGLYRSTPTGMDYSLGRLMVFTYKDAYLYRGDSAEDWIASPATRIPLPPINGLEAGALSGRQFWFTGERYLGRDRMGVYEGMLVDQP